jgi:ribose transport system permease protein
MTARGVASGGAAGGLSLRLAALRDQTAAIIAVALFATFAIAVPDTFLNPDNLANITRQISLDAPLVIGQMIVLIAGGIDISVGATMAAATAVAIGLQPWGTGTAVVAALLAGAIVGIFNGLLVTRGKIVPFVATLGSMSVVRGTLLTLTGQQPLSGTDDAFHVWGGGSIGIVPVPLVISLAIVAALSFLLARTRLGRDLYAVGGNRESAFSAGIAVNRTLLIAFTMSGLLAAVSGVLIASRLNASTVQLGNDSALLSISAALIGGGSLLGGRGKVVGAFIGVLALGMLTNGMNLIGVHTHWQIAVKALILIGVVVLDALMRSVGRRPGVAG